jgi:hypothetical protein
MKTKKNEFGNFYFYLLFSLLVIETLQNLFSFFFQKFIFDFIFWWIFNNTKSIAENPIVKPLGEISQCIWRAPYIP